MHMVFHDLSINNYGQYFSSLLFEITKIPISNSICLLFFLKKDIIKSVWKRMFLYKWPFYDLFWPSFCNMYVNLSQNWGSDGHFEVLNRSYFRLVQTLWHKTQIFLFLFFCDFVQKQMFSSFAFFLCVFFVITFVPIKI